MSIYRKCNVFLALYSRSPKLTIFYKLMISNTLLVTKSGNRFFRNILSICLKPFTLSERFRDFKALTCFADFFPRPCLNRNM